MSFGKIKKVFRVLAGLLLILICTLLTISFYVKIDGSHNIIAKEDAAELEDMDCILVLGCRVKPDGTPSSMLEDRIRMGVELYESGASLKLLMSGDHREKYYNEVGLMKKYAVDKGVPSKDVFMDHAGLSTYDSIYRAKEIFGVKKMIIVTQEYHLSRALYIAERLGIEAYGVVPDYNTYRDPGQWMRSGREVLARLKDFALAQAKPESLISGEKIPISGNGDITNDTE